MMTYPDKGAAVVGSRWNNLGEASPLRQEQSKMTKADDVPMPLMITVESVIDILRGALETSIQTHGDASKAFAWDVQQHFLAKLPRARSVTLDPKAGEG